MLSASVVAIAAARVDTLTPSTLDEEEGRTWRCPIESEVMDTRPERRWDEWACAAPDPKCCHLPTDLVSCGPGIGPCTVHRVLQTRAHNVTSLRLLLSPLVEPLVNGSLGEERDHGHGAPSPSAARVAALAHRVVRAAHAGTVEELRTSVWSAVEAWREARWAEMTRVDATAGSTRRLLAAALHVARREANATLAAQSGLEEASQRLCAAAHQDGRRDGMRERSREAAAVARPEEGRKAAPILFVHVSKAGGTAFCVLAQDNLRTKGYPGRHNMWAAGDGPVWCYDEAIELSCEERKDKFRSNGWELMAMERYLDDGGALLPCLARCLIHLDAWTPRHAHLDPRPPTPLTHKRKQHTHQLAIPAPRHPAGVLCPGIDYVGILRDPVPRVISHLNHFFRLHHVLDQRLIPALGRGDIISTIVGSGNAGCSAEAMLERLFDWDYAASIGHNRSAARPPFGRASWGTLCGVVNNYQLRSLLGTSLDPAPFGVSNEAVNFGVLLGRAVRTMMGFRLMLLLAGLHVQTFPQSPGTASPGTASPDLK